MFSFLPYDADLGYALAQSYNLPLVVVSYLIAALAAYAGLMMSARIAHTDDAMGRRIWFISGSIAMAIGIWAMHFTGMLALTLPCGVTYDVPTTIVSVVPAILASALAIGVMSGHGNRHLRYLIGGTLLGVGIGTMHYVGMAAMRLNAVYEYDPKLFLLSLIVAVLLGIAALYLHDLRNHLHYSSSGRRLVFLSAGLMGLAVTGMHYTAMAAVHFFPDPAIAPPVVAVETLWLSISVIAIAVIIVLLAIMATIVGRAFQVTARRARVDQERVMDAIESINDGFSLFDDKGSLTICNHILHEMYPELAKTLTPGTQYRDLLVAWADLRKEFPGGVSAEDYIAESLRNFQERRHVGVPREEQLKDGRWIYGRENSIKHGGLVSVLTDITLIKELQAVYEKLADQDALTGLVSRRLFDDRLDHAIALANRLGKILSLLYIDLDRFKPINDNFGHDVGDAVLKEVALRLRKAARNSDTVARLGGDEFAVLTESDGDRAGAAVLADRIINSLSQSIFVDGQECHVGASIGVAMLLPEMIDKEDLIRAADEAMYEAKRAGGNRYHIHDPVSEGTRSRSIYDFSQDDQSF